MRLALLLIIVGIPLLELAVLIRVGQLIGVAATLAIVIGTALLGLLVVRLTGLAIIGRARESLAEGRPPVMPVAESLLLFLAGVLLILPGLIGDTIGLLLLIPPLRRLVATFVLGRVAAEGGARVRVFTTGRWRRKPGGGDGERQPKRSGPVIEGEYTRVDEPGGDRDNPRQ